MKVVLYCRVSTDGQDAGKQEVELTSFCHNRGYDVVGCYTDVASGSKDSRPQLNQLMIDGYAHKFDGVVIWKLDRLGRSLQHLIDIVNKFDLWKIHLVCVTQDIDTTTPNGKLLFHIFGAVAEFERQLISERTKMGLRYAKNVGKRGKDKGVRKKGGYFLRHRNKRMTSQGK